MKRLTQALLTAGVVLAAPAMADSISVTPLAFYLTPKQRFQDIKVRNTGDDKAYVKVEPLLIKNAGLKDEQEVEMNFDNPYQFGLLVSPSKLVIPEAQVRRVRVSALPNETGHDRIYRIKIMPVHGEWVKVDSHRKDVNVKVNLIQGYAVNVVSRPLQPKPEITLSRQGKNLTISNRGNSYARVYGLQQCQAGQCAALPGKSVLPMYEGVVKTITLPKAAAVEVKVLMPNKDVITKTST